MISRPSLIEKSSKKIGKSRKRWKKIGRKKLNKKVKTYDRLVINKRKS